MNRVSGILWWTVILFVVLITPLRASAQERVEVRTGDHPTFSRIVFDWQEMVSYTPDLTRDRLEITFDKASIPNWNTLLNAPLKYMEQPEYHIENGQLVVAVKVAEASQLRHFRLGTKTVFDITGKDNIVDITGKDIIGKDGDSVVSVALPLATQPVISVDTEPVEQIVNKIKRQRLTDQGDLILVVDRKWDNLRLEYLWSENVRAAVFMRHNHLWVVFEGKRIVDQTALGRFLGQRILSVRQLDHPTMTILMYDVIPGQNVKSQRVDATWRIDLTDFPVASAVPILTGHQRAAGNRGENFFFSVDDTGSVLLLDDPVIGDALAIVPVMESSQGVWQTQKFAEFESLATAQGIAVQLIADNLNILKYRNGISVAIEGGLALSRSPLSSKLGMIEDTGPDSENSGKLMNFSAWKQGPLDRGDYHANKHELLYLLSSSTDINRSERRWKLARFYLANGRTREAFGVLNVMLDGSPGLVDNPEFRAVLGVTNILMHRFAEGAKLLDHKSLISERDVFLWRAVADSAMGNHEKAFESYKKGSDILSLHTQDNQVRFLFAAIYSAYELGDRNFVEFSLSFLQNLPLTAAQLAEVGYWQALLERDKGNLLQAEAILQGLVNVGGRQTAARAKFDLINMELKAGKTDAIEAIDQLEKLRFAWRGDNFELELLSRLGEIYVQQNEYNTGLQTLRLAITFFGSSPKTAELTRQMSKIYSDLFLNGGANILSPVRAVALYSEFQELIPLGKDGDTMTRRLADRLVSLDLLEEAAELLNHQIKFRLKGSAQSVVASRLAMVYLLDSRPEEALGILRATRNSQTPDDVQDRRRMIEGRTLIELGQYEEAEVLIEEFKTDEAEAMRSDIYWKSNNWTKFIDHKNRMLGNRYQEDQELDPTERLAVLRLSVAYVINEDKVGVKDLRNKYKAHMDNGLYGDTFEVITAERQLTDLNISRLTSSIASVAKLETFMQSYKAEFSGGAAQN